MKPLELHAKEALDNAVRRLIGELPSRAMARAIMHSGLGSVLQPYRADVEAKLAAVNPAEIPQQLKDLAAQLEIEL